jgi:DNA polymerase (family 10)
MTVSIPTNDEIAGVLEEVADLLEAQNANIHRVRAYRKAAGSLRSAERSVAMIARQGGRQALERMPGIGAGLAGLIQEYVYAGRSGLLDRLKGEVCAEDVFVQVPGIGEELAHRIAARLGIDSLEGLERAAQDGRLASVTGFGPKRVHSVQVALTGMLSRAAQRRVREVQEGKSEWESERPSAEALLGVDQEYREGAEAGKLRTIAPKRFNPQGEAWLPVLHTEKEGWNFTALYSNTARAHELGRTHDWVVIYYERHGHESQATVVTARRGDLEGERVVKGREAECRRFYQRAGHQ